MDQPQTTDQHTHTHTASDPTCDPTAPHSEAGTIVLAIQELLEEVLKHLPPGALLRHQSVCKNWHYTINKYAHFQRSLFLLPAEAAEVWDIDRRAAHKHFHGGHDQVVLGKARRKTLTSKGKLPITCRICESRDLPRPEEHNQSRLLPIQFNPLFCDQRPEDKADSLDERASRPACAEIILLDWGLRDEKPQPWHSMLLTQPASRHVQVHVSGDHEGFCGGYAAVLDGFEVRNQDGVRLGQILALMKERLHRHFRTGEIHLDYVTVFVRNAIEVMEGDEKEVEKRTRARHEEMPSPSAV